ncbi:hypothetical protein WN943_026868 [Citrus x changshan-huyou]
MGHFPSSFGFVYILVVVDYVSKWIEAIPCRHNDHKIVIHFLKENLLSRFGIPRAIISDGGISTDRLVYEKSCHLPVELEHKSFWVIKAFNSNLDDAGNKIYKVRCERLRLLMINEIPADIRWLIDAKVRLVEGVRSAAIDLGRAIVETKLHLVYGGGDRELSKLVSEAAFVRGSQVLGIIPKALNL